MSVPSSWFKAVYPGQCRHGVGYDEFCRACADESERRAKERVAAEQSQGKP